MCPPFSLTSFSLPQPFCEQILEFDLRGIPLDSSSSLVIVVKDFETIGQNKLIGTATVSLKDLIGDQNRSLPYKQISLLNEKGQDTGVSAFLWKDRARWLRDNPFRKDFSLTISSLHKIREAWFHDKWIHLPMIWALFSIFSHRISKFEI